MVSKDEVKEEVICDKVKAEVLKKEKVKVR